jgi:Fic family protein
MHVEIRKKGGKRIYYLAHSYRKAGKVKKIRVYLGTDLSDNELEKKKKLAEEKIKKRIEDLGKALDPYQTILSSSEINELKSLEPKGKIKLLHLSEEDWLKFSEIFTYDTNAIEGSTITEKEVEGILEKNKWPDKPKDEISETYGVADAVKHVRKTREHISLKLIQELHRIVFKNSKTFAGKFRKKGIEVVIADGFGNIVHRGAPSTQVTVLLKKLVKWHNENKKKYPPLVLAAVIHNQFENIHPFQDGNGRVGRLLLINILLKNGLPPLNIELKNRRQYYSALQAYQRKNNLKPMVKLMLKEYRKMKKLFKHKIS